VLTSYQKLAELYLGYYKWVFDWKNFWINHVLVVIIYKHLLTGYEFCLHELLTIVPFINKAYKIFT